MHYRLVSHVDSGQHQPFLLLLLLLSGCRACLHVPCQDLFGLNSKLLQLAVGPDSSHQERYCLLVLLQLHLEAVVLVLNLLDFLETAFLGLPLFERIAVPHNAAHDGLLVRESALPFLLVKALLPFVNHRLVEAAHMDLLNILGLFDDLILLLLLLLLTLQGFFPFGLSSLFGLGRVRRVGLLF